MNSLILIGRLTKDPEVKEIATGKNAAKFTLAVDRDYKDSEGNKITDFIHCDAIGQPADFISQYITKGRLVCVQGSMRVDQYQDSEGANKSFTKCAVRNIQALDSQKEAGNVNANTATASKANTQKPATKPTKPGKKISKPATA